MLIALHLRFFQFILLKLYRKNNENKQKEAGIGSFFLNVDRIGPGYTISSCVPHRLGMV